MICLSAAELLVNTVSILTDLEKQYGSASYQEYWDYYTANAKLAAAARENAGGQFFRMGAAEDRGHNSPLSFGYPGITHYSSLYNYDVNELTRKLGFAQSWMWCAYYGSTPVTDALLGVRYVAAPSLMPPGYERVAREGGTTLWKNLDVLPLAFFGADEAGPLDGDTPFERQNSILSSLAGEETAVFTLAEAESSVQTGETSFSVTGTGKSLYADLSASGLREVLVNGERVLELGSSEAASVHYIGTPPVGEAWTVTVRHASGWTGQLWELDHAALHDAVEQVNGAEVASVEKNGRVRLTAETDRARPLLTTIPAEDGWRAYVDGVRVDTGRWLDTFLQVDVQAGAHEVELRYIAPGLAPGVGLGALAALGLALSNIKNYFKRQKNRKKPDPTP